MFCSEECQGNSLHKHECGLKAFQDNNMNGPTMRNVRSCLLAIDMFANADELMKFVEQSLKSDPYQMPTVLSDEKSQYKIFLKLSTGPKSTIPQNIACTVFEVYRMLLTIPRIKSMFSSEKSLRFLMHLIGHHYYALQYNSTVSSNRFADNPMNLSSQVGLITRYFKHSCAPNVFVSSFHGNTVITSVRPIKKGEQLMYSYLMIMTKSKEERQKDLWERKRFICTCLLCNGMSASTSQCEQLAADPDFQNIVSNFAVYKNQDNDPDILAMIEKCKYFLQKYGRILWCYELGKVVESYCCLLNLRYRRSVRIGSLNQFD